MNKLYLQSDESSVFSCAFQLNLKNSHINFCFDIKTKDDSQWNLDPSFSQSSFFKNWNLWETDVIEIFIQKRLNHEDYSAPYLELQASPLGQGFCLWILEPRKIQMTPLENLFRLNYSKNSLHWKGEFSIDLKNNFFSKNGEEIYAGVFACLGKKREYHCHYPYKSQEIDFHRPQLFENIKKV